MTTKQRNRRQMQRAARAIAGQHPATSADPILAVRLAAFDAKQKEIDELEAKQAEPLSRQLAKRNEAFAAMVQETFAIAGLALSHAQAHGMTSLAIVVRIMPSEFTRNRFDRRVHMCQQIANAVRAELPRLVESGIREARLDAFQTLIDTAAALTTVPRSTVAAKRGATSRLVVALREADEMLADGIDPLLLPLAATHPEFHATYAAAREIVDRPATHAAAGTAAANPPANAAPHKVAA